MDNFLRIYNVAEVDSMYGKEVYFSIFPDEPEGHFVYKGTLLGYGAYGKNPVHKTFCVYVDRGDGYWFVDYLLDQCFKSREDYEEFKRQRKEKDENFQLSLKDLYELEKIEDIKTRDKVLKAATDSRDLVWKAKQAVTEETRIRNKKLFAELFKKAGIKKAPDGTENERYSGKWDILQSWQLDKEAPKSLKKFKEGALWVVFWNSEIAVIAPAQKQKRELTEYEIKEKEKAKAKKELKQRHKALYAEIDRFLMGIITKEIAPLKEDVVLYKALILATIKGNVDYYRSDLANLFSGKSLYDLKEEEPDKYKEFLEWEKNLSPLHLAIAHMTSIKKCEMYNYNVEYHQENAGKVKAIVDFLAMYGFSISEEE